MYKIINYLGWGEQDEYIAETYDEMLKIVDRFHPDNIRVEQIARSFDADELKREIEEKKEKGSWNSKTQSKL